MRRVVLLLAVAAPAAPAAPAAAGPPPEAVALQNHLRQVIKTAKPSVACVLVSRSNQYAEFRQGPSAADQGKLGEFHPPPTSRFADARQRELVRRLDLAYPDTVPESYGSGVVIDDRGLVLTTYHVIAGATKVFVRLPGPGRASYADILAADPRADLAVLKMIHAPADLKAIPMGDGGKVDQGDWVVALSNPFAAGFKDGNPSASWGIIANTRRRSFAAPDETRRAKPLAQYGTLLETDARLNLGCTGGALLNMDGELVGLTSAVAAVTGGEGAGAFAIPMDANTKKMIDVLKRGEEIEYGLLGITVNPEERGNGRGVMIQDATAGMPAARAGLLARDVITAINGNPIREQDDLFLQISAALAGSEAEIEVDRNGRKRTFKARLGKSASVENEQQKPIVSSRPKPVHGLRVDFVSLTNDPAAPEGVLVKEVVPDSPAAKKLKDWVGRGIVTAVDGQPVSVPADFYRLAGGKASVTLDLVEVGDGSARQKVTLP